MTMQLLFFFWGLLANELLLSVVASYSVVASRSQRTDSPLSRTLAYSMRLGKLDYMLDAMSRRVEAIESKLNHFEVRMDVRMEKIEEAVMAKDLKGEFATDQLSRQLDSLGEKLMNKLAFLEAKMNMKVDNLNSRMERSDRHLQHSLEGLKSMLGNTDDKQVQSESHLWSDLGQVEEINNSIQDLKSFITRETEDKVMKKLQEIGEKVDTGFQGIDNELEAGQTVITDLKAAVMISNSLTEESVNLLEMKLNSSCDGESHRARTGGQLSQREASSSHLEDIDTFATKAHEQLENITNAMGEALRMGESKFRELDNDVEIYTKKVLNAYYELLKGSREIEQQLATTLTQGNQTRMAVQDGFRRVYHQLRPLTALEPKIEEMVDGLQMKILDLSTTVDSSFATLLVAQNAFIASCHRIQQQEPQIESRIHDAIQKITQDKATSSTPPINGTLGDGIHCSHESILGNLLWTLFSIGNQTRDDMSALTTQITSLHRAFVSANAHSRCMISAGDWTSLSQACSIMHGRIAPPQSESLSTSTHSERISKERQAQPSSTHHHVNRHVSDGTVADASRPPNAQHIGKTSDTHTRTNQRQWHHRGSKSYSAHNNQTSHQSRDSISSPTAEKHSISQSSEETEIEDSPSKGHDYDYEEDWLDDYPDH